MNYLQILTDNPQFLFCELKNLRPVTILVIYSTYMCVERIPSKKHALAESRNIICYLRLKAIH